MWAIVISGNREWIILSCAGRVDLPTRTTWEIKSRQQTKGVSQHLKLHSTMSAFCLWIRLGEMMMRMQVRWYLGGWSQSTGIPILLENVRAWYSDSLGDLFKHFKLRSGSHKLYGICSSDLIIFTREMFPVGLKPVCALWFSKLNGWYSGFPCKKIAFRFKQFLNMLRHVSTNTVEWNHKQHF